MAHHAPRLLNEVLSSDYRDLIDSSGQPVIPSDAIYNKISEKISDAEYNISAKYIYTIFKNNRYGTWDKILAFHNVDIRDDSKLDDSEMDTSSKHPNSKEEITFQLNIPYKTWVIMTPEELRYSDKVLSERNYTVLTRKVWTDTLFELLWDQTDVPCPFSFKRCKITESGIFLKVSGSCSECGSSFSGMIANKPAPRRDVRMECSVLNFDESVVHRKKRQLKGQRRIQVSTKLVESNILPCIWRRNEADKLMEFGDPEPAHLPTNSVLRKAKQERENINFGLKGIDPMENLRVLKYDRHAGTIHSIGFDPVYVHYWTPQQVAIYLNNSKRVCIDGTGSLIKKLKRPTGELCPHIYLYQIVTETAGSKVPVFQMLSASQNTNSITYWLNEIVRIGSKHRSNFPIPKQVVCDFDKALMGAVARAFGQCTDLKDYLSKCFKCINQSSDQLPSCFLRLDVSHYVHMICRWDILSKIHPLARTLYIMVMCYLTKVTAFDEFQDVVKSTVILCDSQSYGDSDDGLPCLAQKAFQQLHRITRGQQDRSVTAIMDHAMTNKAEKETPAVTPDDLDLDSTRDRNACAVEESETSQAEHKIEVDVDNIEDIPLSIVEWADSFYTDCKDAAKEGELGRNGEDANPYYAPDVGHKIKQLLHYFPLYTQIMRPIFGFGPATATSSAVESEFNDLKNRLLRAKPRPIRIDKFVDTHIKSFSGRMKLAESEEHTSRNVDDVKAAIVEKKKSTIVDNIAANPDSQLEEVQPEKKVKPTSNTNEKKKNSSDILDDNEATKIDINVTTRYVGEEINVSDRNLSSNSDTQPPSSTVKTGPVMLASSSPGEQCFNVQDEQASIEESPELTLEHNWRNKNEPTKLRQVKKRVYLDPRPELGVATSERSRKAAMSLLPNGNLCSSFVDKRKRFVVINTCGFDSIQQILVAACINDKFNAVIENASSEIFKFTKMFAAKGPCKPIYKERARLIGKSTCFVDEKTPGVVTIDALSNICNLCDCVYFEEPSFVRRKQCFTCKNDTSINKLLVSLDVDMIREHGFSQLGTAIQRQNDRQSGKRCSSCKAELHIHHLYRSHLFVDCMGGTGDGNDLDSFPKTLSLNGSTYILAGVVHFRSGRTLRQPGHYTAYARYGDEWVLFDDLCNKSKRLTKAEKINPVLCIYVEK